MANSYPEQQRVTLNSKELPWTANDVSYLHYV